MLLQCFFAACNDFNRVFLRFTSLVASWGWPGCIRRKRQELLRACAKCQGKDYQAPGGGWRKYQKDVHVLSMLFFLPRNWIILESYIFISNKLHLKSYSIHLYIILWGFQVSVSFVLNDLVFGQRLSCTQSAVEDCTSWISKTSL